MLTPQDEEAAQHGASMMKPCGKETVTHRENLLLVGVIVAAFVVRVVVAIATKSWVFPNKDHFWPFGYEMGRIGAAIAAGEGFAWPSFHPHPGPTAWMPPVYPFIIGGVFKIFGTYSTTSALVLEGFQVIASMASCVLLFCLGKRLFCGRVGLVAALLLAVYPPGLHFTVQKIWSTQLFVFALLGVILLFLSLAEVPSLKQSVLTGVSLGITSLIDPVIFAFWPFALGWLFFRRQAHWSTRVKAIAIVLLALSVTTAPWLVRNYLVFGRFVFIKSNFGWVLWVGNAGKKVLSAAERQYVDQADEGQQSSFYRKKALTYIKNHPLTYSRQIAGRISRYWTRTKSKPGMAVTIARSSYLALLILGIAGICLSWRKGEKIHLLLLALFSLPIPYYLTVVRFLHYRFPVEVLLMVFASYTISRLYTLSFQALQSLRPSVSPP